jgi:uncharacterized protein with HEPN domain
MRPDVETLLQDVLDACDAILAFVAGKSVEQFVADDLLRSGVYFKFVIIGESLSKLRQLDEPTYDAIGESWRIVGFRNQVVHGYAQIRDEITWRIIETKVPVLRRDVQVLMGT